VICDAYEVVVVPFPFTDRTTSKRRPAVVLSDESAFNGQVGACVLAMITSQHNAPWPLDTAIQDLRSAGLESASVVRMKLFTLDQQLILRKAGRLSVADERRVRIALRRLLRLPPKTKPPGGSGS
jgi:mRNA interferase MazF